MPSSPPVSISTPASTLPAQHAAVVVLRQLTKTYGIGAVAVQALRGVDLDIRPGELLMLVGPSGCGKTTLISVIAGVLDRDGGDCRVFDVDFLTMSANEVSAFRSQHIGFCFQAFNLIPSVTAAENVAIPLIINGMRRRPAVAQAKEMLSRVGFDERMMRSSPTDLSGGQQQRVAIARALVHRPKLIVCDEPTSALDGETGRKVMELLRKLSSEAGCVLVVVTHDSRVFSFADRIAHMEDGRITSITNGTSP